MHFVPKVYTLLAQSVYTFDQNVCIFAGNVYAILPKMYAFLHTRTIYTCVRNVHIYVYIYIYINMCVAKKLCQEPCVYKRIAEAVNLSLQHGRGPGFL